MLGDTATMAGIASILIQRIEHFGNSGAPAVFGKKRPTVCTENQHYPEAGPSDQAICHEMPTAKALYLL